MTREEKINTLTAIIQECEEYQWQRKEILFEIIKDLEQESVIDKIRAEIETKYGQCDICEYFEDYDFEENDISEYRPIGDIADILQKLVEVDKIELAGDSARSMGHGLAVYKDGAKLIDVLFIETDKDKIDAFDPLEEQENEDGNNN